eukprot:84168-Chlamydomonas_euryale.AAC.2
MLLNLVTSSHSTPPPPTDFNRPGQDGADTQARSAGRAGAQDHAAVHGGRLNPAKGVGRLGGNAARGGERGGDRKSMNS